MTGYKMDEKPTIIGLEEEFKSKNKNKTVVFEYISKAFYLGYFDFVIKHFNEFLTDKILLEKEDNEIIILFVKAQNKLKRYEENIKFWEKFKSNIKLDYQKKGTILNHIAFSYIQLEKICEALDIYSLIKNLESYYHENYIDCFMQLNRFEEALKEIEKYRPITVAGKVWKVLNRAEIYYKMNDLVQLEKNYKIAVDVYNKFSNSKDIDIHSGYLYMLGTFAVSLNKKPQGILHFKNSVLVCSDGLIDNIYKDKSIDELKKMGVNNI